MAAKIYILVREEVAKRDLGHAILSVAHAAAAAFTMWDGENDVPDGCVSFGEWKASFRKALCLVSDKEFEKAKTYFPEGKCWRVLTECAIDNEEISLVFRPRVEWPGFFRSLRLWR